MDSRDSEHESSIGIAESLARTDYGAALAARGVTDATLNDDGDIVLHHPDGSSTVLIDQAGAPPGLRAAPLLSEMSRRG